MPRRDTISEPPPMSKALSRESLMEAEPPARQQRRSAQPTREGASGQRQQSARQSPQQPPQQRQSQQQPSQRLQQGPQLTQQPPRRQPSAAEGATRGMLVAAGCVSKWTYRRLLTFLAGMGLGLLVPVAFASILWGSQAIGWNDKDANATITTAAELLSAVSVNATEAADETFWERTQAHAEENPVNTVTGAVLFGSVFYVWAHGGGTEVAWVSKALARVQTVDDIQGRRRSVTTQELHTKSQAIGWGALLWALLGAATGAMVVLFVLSSHTRKGGTVVLAMLLGAGTLGPLGASIGSSLEAVDKAMSGGLRDHHWLSAMRAYSRPSRCLASCSRAIASLPCFCGLFKVPGGEVTEDGKPIMVPSPRMLVTWIGVIIGALIFALAGVAIGAAVSESKEATLEDFFGYAAAVPTADGTNSSTVGETTEAGSLQRAVLFVQGVDKQLAPHFRQLRKERDNHFEGDMTQVLLLALCSLVWDVVVLYYHLVTAPHPKFRLRFIRRLSIYTHIWAGIGEILISVFAFVLYCEVVTDEDTGLTPDELCTEKEQERSLLLVYAQVFCACAHIVTAAYQTPQVFGMQVVMIPAYSAVIAWKAVCVLRLALYPNSLWLLLQLFFVHHIYVWCRAMHVILEELGIFSENTYSVSIMFAGFICGPITVGPAGNLAVIAVIAGVGLLRLPYLPKEEQQEWRMEKRSNMLLNERYREALRMLAGGHTSGLYKLAATADANQQSDEPQTVYAPPHAGMTVTSLKVHVGSVVQPGQAIATLSPSSASLTGEVAAAANREAKLQEKGGSSDETRARMIFDALDDDGDGVLQQEEVVALLLSWGIPYHEALQCFKSYDTGNEREVSFAQFFGDWEPVWRFQLSRIDEAVKHFVNFSEAVAVRAADKKQSGVISRSGSRP